MSRRRRRIRSPHPGVVLKQRRLPSGRTAWRARFVDPETGRQTYKTLDAVALSTHDARTVWAKDKSRDLAARRLAVERGAHRAIATPLTRALEGYLGTATARLRARTLTTYRQALTPFVDWAGRQGVASTAVLTRAHLSAYRDHLIRKPRKAAKLEGKRGERRETNRKRSPLSVNRELRALKTMLNTWRSGGQLAKLDRDAIEDTLKALPVAHEQASYLAPSALAKLLRAALRHDAAVFEKGTRAELAGLRTKGTTPRYDPIAPFVAFLLLTGCRRGEALALTWAQVDLDAVDSQGRKIGEIKLSAAQTKTHRGRSVGLDVSPALRALLAAMKLRAGKGAEYVFELLDAKGKRQPYTGDLVESARQRMLSEWSAPPFDFQLLRSTCATFLTNAPGIFGNATVYLSARQLGHSVAVAEKHYLGVHRGIPKDASTLEAAMQIEGALREVLAAQNTDRVSGLTIGQGRGE